MDCGPACLKCLLDGFETHVSYGRLREACQTGIDGTSIDTMEVVANQLGLDAEQIMIPVDHLLLAEGNTFPALVVVKLANGLTHFVVLWRLHGNIAQIMDPAIGRRWTRVAEFANEVYNHSMPVAAADWREFTRSDDFQRVFAARLSRLGISKHDAKGLQSRILDDGSWREIAALDASLRMTASLVRVGRIGGRLNTVRLIEQLRTNAELIPDRFWSVRAGGRETHEEQLVMRGAVLVRIRGKRSAPARNQLGPELRAAIDEAPLAPGRELMRLVREAGRAAPWILTSALVVGAVAVLIEALLFRSLFEISGALNLTIHCLGAMIAILVFSLAILLLEVPIFTGAARLGRQVENRLRAAFLRKIPKLGDRYFQSRLISDMAERSHTIHRLRALPELARQMLRSMFELCATAAGIIWLDPAATPWVLLSVAAALIPLMAQSVLAERDLRVRSHAAALTRFHLDSMLGLLAIRAHSAEGSMRKEHEKLLGEWTHAALRFQKAVTGVEAVQIAAMFGIVAALLLFHPLAGANVGRVLLIVYWALNLPSLGQEIAFLSRQYPYYRNLTLRLLDPLAAPEEAPPRRTPARLMRLRSAPSIEFRDVEVEASGHKILERINLRVDAGSHVAIVGPSGAGKSSLVGILLGWLKPSEGEVLVDGVPLSYEELRSSIAWVDPAVQLWNRSLFANLSYGSDTDAAAIGEAIDAALLRGVLSTLPEGLQTNLGEGGALVSGGEGQRVRFGRAMLRKDARLVVLDEPFRGLDREKRRELLARAREHWCASTLFCITHDISETQEFDRVLVIEGGRIAEDGTPGELCASPDSRYARLLEAEDQTRSSMWGASVWRRIRIHGGRIVEQHTTVEEKRREVEVA